jgi:phage-related protein
MADKEEYHAFRRKVTEDLRQLFENAVATLDAKLDEIEKERQEDEEKEGVPH